MLVVHHQVHHQVQDFVLTWRKYWWRWLIEEVVAYGVCKKQDLWLKEISLLKSNEMED
jgi:hypothetical protein